MDKLRLAVVGLGRHGSRYAHHAASDVDEIQLRAICRRSADAGKELAARLGCDFTDDASKLVRSSEIDAVVLVIPPRELEELLPAALECGKRVLVEKPVAPDLESGRRILEVQRRKKGWCMAGQTLRFNSVCRAIRDSVPRVGRLDSLVFSQRFPPQPQLRWLDDPALSGGGNILHTGVHCFDLVRWLSDLEVESVSCFARSVCTKKTEDSFVANLSLRGSDALAVVTCSRSTHSRNGLIEISGDKGQLIGDHVLGTLSFIGPDGVETLAPPAPSYTVLEILRQFAKDAINGTSPCISYGDGLAAVAIADACYRSARSGMIEPVRALE
ncbi:MAG: Gfo/Idh/MocA family protein [Candidatus Binatia bacterium]